MTLVAVNTFFTDQVLEVLIGAQTEIGIFLIALCTHAVFFGKNCIPVAKAKQGKKHPWSNRGSQPTGSKNNGSPGSQFTVHVASHGSQARDKGVHHNAIRKALDRGSVQEASHALDAMLKEGFKPDRVTLNELLDATIKSGTGDGWSIVDKMLASGLKPDNFTCSIILKKSLRPDNVAGVVRVLELADKVEGDVDEVLLNSIIQACLRVQRLDLLVPQLERWRKAKTQVRNPFTYANAIRAYGCNGDLNGVWQMWDQMKDCQVKPESITLGVMMEALTTNGDVEASYKLLSEMLADPHTKPLVNAVVYGSVLKGFSHQKRFDRVLSVYQEMLDHKLTFSLVTYNTLFDACARSGEMVRIPDFLKEMKNQGIELNIMTYSIIVKGYCQENRLEDALKVWKDMVETTTLIPDEVMYNTILAGCARQGLYDRGIALLREMEHAGIRPTNYTLSVLVKLANRAKLVDKAFELCAEISETYKFRLNVHVFNNLMQGCIAARDLQRGLDVLERMVVCERVKPDARTYSLLIPACISARRPQDAADLIRAAVGLGWSPSMQDGKKGWAGPSRTKESGSFMKVRDGVSSSLLSDSLESISRDCGQNTLALSLMMDLKVLPGMRFPPQLQMRLATKATQK